MSYISVNQVNAWYTDSKVVAQSLDTELEMSIVEQAFASLRKTFDVSSWTNDTNTPSLVKKIIAMIYAGWYYERTVSENNNTLSYGMLLINSGNKLLEDLVGGTILLDPAIPVVDAVGTYSQGAPGFEPTALDAGPYFSMGQIW